MGGNNEEQSWFFPLTNEEKDLLTSLIYAQKAQGNMLQLKPQQCKRGVAHGEGVFITKGGETTYGTFQNNMKHGFCCIKQADGSKEIGEFQNDLRSGKITAFDTKGVPIAN